jgi:transposase
MTKSQVEIITLVQRRRRWTTAENERLVAASLEPGACGCAESGMHPGQLYGWPRRMCARPLAGLAPVRTAPAAQPRAGTIESQLAFSRHGCLAAIL